jgi:hypothetical protein
MLSSLSSTTNAQEQKRSSHVNTEMETREHIGCVCACACRLWTVYLQKKRVCASEELAPSRREENVWVRVEKEQRFKTMSVPKPLARARGSQAKAQAFAAAVEPFLLQHEPHPDRLSLAADVGGGLLDSLGNLTRGLGRRGSLDLAKGVSKQEWFGYDQTRVVVVAKLVEWPRRLQSWWPWTWWPACYPSSSWRPPSPGCDGSELS